MYKKDEILVVIPARGGSKRVPKKNILKIVGKPMILWTLQAVTKFIDKKNIIVSTDDKKTAEIVASFGIEVPFMRPKGLADDFTTTSQVSKHALSWYEKKNKNIKYIIIVYPTSIFIECNDLLNAYEFMESNKDCTVFFTVAEYSHPIQRAIRSKGINQAQMINPKYYNARTQDLEKSYYDAGLFYFCKSEIVRNSKPLFNKDSNFVVLPKTRAIDIDNMEDVKFAKLLMQDKIKC